MAKHPCPYDGCGSTFSRPYRLRIHVQRHQGIKGFRCGQCDRGYHRRQHLQRHVAEAHEQRPRLDGPLACDHCDRRFDTAWGLRRHRAAVAAQKTRVPRGHGCEACGRRFFSGDDLRRHSLVHERFACDVPSCPVRGNRFSWPCYRRHMADRHSEPFECHHCGERFLVKGHVRRHVRRHMPGHACPRPGCGRTFATAKSLATHVLKGHGERSYACDVPGCDWRFRYKVCLVKHAGAHRRNGRIVPMANRTEKKKEPSFYMAKKLATLACKV